MHIEVLILPPKMMCLATSYSNSILWISKRMASGTVLSSNVYVSCKFRDMKKSKHRKLVRV